MSFRGCWLPGRSEELLQRKSIVSATSGSGSGSPKHLDSSGAFLSCGRGEQRLACRHVFSRSASWPGRRVQGWKRQHVRARVGSRFFCEISFPPALKTCCCLPSSPCPPFTSDWLPKGCCGTCDCLQGFGKALSFSTQVCLAHPFAYVTLGGGPARLPGRCLSEIS